MCCTRLAANTGRKKNLHFGTIAQLCRVISSELRHVSTIGKKNLLNSNPPPYVLIIWWTSATAEICWRVWGTPANFNGFRRVLRLGSITARHSSSRRQPNFAALNRGRHLYLARRPSRWALTYILAVSYFDRGWILLASDNISRHQISKCNYFGAMLVISN